MRLTIRLDTLRWLEGGAAARGLLRAGALADAAGADGILVTLPVDNPESMVRGLTMLREAVEVPLAVAAPLKDDAVRAAVAVGPEAVVLIGRGEPFSPVEISELQSGQTKDIALRVLDGGLALSAYIRPQIPEVRAARQIGAAFVILDASAGARQEEPAGQIEVLETIETAALGATKLGMRVYAAGGIDRDLLASLSPLDTLEGVVLGDELLRRALRLGLGAALAEFHERARWSRNQP